MARAISQVRTFAQKESLRLRHHAKHERHAAPIQNLALHNRQFDIENFLQLLGTKLMENDYAVQTVHEFRRESAARRFHGGTFQFQVKTFSRFAGRFDKSHFAADQGGDFARAQVGSEEDDGLRKIDAAGIAESQSGLVEDRQQQLPEGVAGFFDFVEEQKAELELLGMILAQTFFGNQRVSVAMAEVSGGRPDEF